MIWTRVTFNNAIAPGPKTFDFDINEFSITDERKQAVDFSAPYYLVRQTVIALKGSKIAGAKTHRRPARTPSSARRSAPPATRRSPT